MSELIEIHWTSGSIDEARKVSRALVESNLVACAQIIPWMESYFKWDGQLDTAQESKVIMKTKKENFDPIKTFILQNSHYEVPEITSFIIDEINSSYKEWLLDTVGIVIKN